MIEKTVNRIKEDIVIRYTFLGTVIAGLISQGMGIFNTYSSHDDAIALFSHGETYHFGRWLTDIFLRLSRGFLGNGDGVYSLPMFNGLLIIICVAIAACFAVGLLRIHEPLYGAFIGGIMVCVPTITSFFGYLFNGAMYGLGILFAAAGAYYICMSRTIPGTVAGVVSLCCSAGMYQGFMPFALCLLLFYCIGYADDQPADEAVGVLFVKLLAKPLLVLTSVIMYALINKIYLASIGEEMHRYRGMGTLTEVSVGEYMIRVLAEYKQFLKPSRDTMFYIYPSNIRYIYYVFEVIGSICMMMILVRNFRKGVLRGLIMLAMFAMIPLAVYFMMVLTGVENMYSVMTYSEMMPFVVVIYMVDRLFAEKNTRYELRLGFGIMCAFLVFLYSRYDNKLYMIDEFSQQEAISYFNTLITRIQCTDGYRAEYPVCYINEYDKRTGTLAGIGAVTYFDNAQPDFSDVDIDPYWMVDQRINDYAWKYFMNNWCGYFPETIPQEEYASDPRVEDMPRYPDQGSIMVMDDTVVVRF